VAKSLQDILKRRQQEEFVGREEQLAFFRRNLRYEPDDDRRYISDDRNACLHVTASASICSAPPIVAGQFFCHQLAFDCHDVFLQLALKLFKVWRAICPFHMLFHDELSSR
jgi:hypothetical protein